MLVLVGKKRKRRRETAAAQARVGMMGHGREPSFGEVGSKSEPFDQEGQSERKKQRMANLELRSFHSTGPNESVACLQVESKLCHPLPCRNCTWVSVCWII